MNTSITTTTTTNATATAITRAEALEEAQYLRQRAGDSIAALGDCPESQQWDSEASAMEALADALLAEGKGWWILHRTGGVMASFKGSLNEAEAECDRLNETDDGGSTIVLSGHATREECNEALADSLI